MSVTRRNWHPSKYRLRRGRLVPSRHPDDLALSSRLVAGLVARFYDETIRHYAKGTLVDLGCGTAPLFVLYRDFVDRCLWVDWEASMHVNEELDLVQDLNRPIALRSESCDTVVLSDVLEHIYAAPLLVSEIGRILRPTGVLVMNVPFLYGLHETPHDYARYTSFMLNKLMEDSGLVLQP